jgi:hypothetical protein
LIFNAEDVSMFTLLLHSIPNINLSGTPRNLPSSETSSKCKTKQESTEEKNKDLGQYSFDCICI